MIKITLTEPQSQAWAKWKQKCARKKREAIAQFIAGQCPSVSALYKAQKDVFAGLCNGKCAYCEKIIASSQHGDVDHYRPKNGVAEKDWTPVQLRRNGRSGPHPGYFWLAYDPHNLIFSCISCNQVGEGRRWGKGIRFPVGAFRAEEPGEEANEEPQLLNPFLDDPAQHIRVDATGIYSAINGSEKGQTSIDVLGLNERGLCVERAGKYREVRNKMSLILARYDVVGTQETVEQLQQLVSERQEFANVAQAAAREMARETIAVLQPVGAA